MNRRDALRFFCSSMIGGALFNKSALANADDRVLVLVFLRGGFDGLNAVVPYGDDSYYALRPTIAVRQPSATNSASAMDLNGFFGLHPSMASLYSLYQDGCVAILPAVHYAGSSYSHFRGQDVVESASLVSHDSGWLGRYLLQLGGDFSSKALGLSEQIPLSLKGVPAPISAFPNFASLQITGNWIDRQVVADVVDQAYAWPSLPDNPHSTLLHSIGSRLNADLNRLRLLGQVQPAAGVVYPAANFGGQLRQAAALIKARSGVKVVTVDFGGWDTHSVQGDGAADGRMSVLLKTFSDSVSAFIADLGGDASRVLLLAVTEFGRTAAENGSRGTDHGNASAWFAIGPNVQGGIHNGRGWPGLATHQLIEGRGLNHTIDFRDVYACVLSQFLGFNSVSNVLPGYGGAGLNLFA